MAEDQFDVFSTGINPIFFGTYKKLHLGIKDTADVHGSYDGILRVFSKMRDLISGKVKDFIGAAF